MNSPIIVAKNQKEIGFFPQMANRHGLISGATGTGKTVTLQVMAEAFSQQGIPVFMADVKGDLAGLSQLGQPNPKIYDRINQLSLTNFSFDLNPVVFWDVFGQQGHPLRSTISEMGPILLARLLNLNETQAGVLTILFRLADDQGLLLLDLKDLRAMAQHVGEEASNLRTSYGNISPASLGTIQRGLLMLEEQEGDKIFGEPALNLEDFIQTDSQGRGVINILAANKLMQFPKAYGTILLWILSELFENLPEVGDLEKPKLVFFFDEAHLLFNEAPDFLLEKIEQMVRLIRSKGVGVYFVTQNPLDIPIKVLGQLGNRIQHALRSFTPLDQKAVKAAAETFPSNPALDVVKEVTQLAVGEALISFLDPLGRPTPVEKAFIFPPKSRIGAIQPQDRNKLITESVIYGYYENAVDRESAYEVLKQKYAVDENSETKRPASVKPQPAPTASVPPSKPKTYSRTGRPSDDLLTSVTKSAARSAASQLGRSIMRGILGSILGGGKTRRY